MKSYTVYGTCIYQCGEVLGRPIFYTSWEEMPVVASNPGHAVVLATQKLRQIYGELSYFLNDVEAKEVSAAKRLADLGYQPLL